MFNLRGFKNPKKDKRRVGIIIFSTTMENVLLVRNVDSNVASDEDVRSFFANVPGVVEARIGKDERGAILAMARCLDPDAADTFAREYDGFFYFDRRLRTTVATEREFFEYAALFNSSVIRVCGLPDDCGERELKQIFRVRQERVWRDGSSIVHVGIRRRKRGEEDTTKAYVEFDTPETAARAREAVDGYKFSGFVLTLRIANEEEMLNQLSIVPYDPCCPYY